MAMRVLHDGVYVLEFELVERTQKEALESVEQLRAVSDAIYALRPNVPGIV
jgi:hypothetical protein